MHSWHLDIPLVVLKTFKETAQTVLKRDSPAGSIVLDQPNTIRNNIVL